MGLFANKDDRKELKDAREELRRVTKRDKEETADYHKANKRVIDAEKKAGKGAGKWW